MLIVEVDDHNIEAVVALGRELVEAGAFGILGPEFDHEHVVATTQNIIARPDYYLRMALDDDGVPCGFVCGHVVHFYFAPVNCAYEDAWYVRPGTKSRAKVGLSLMRGFMSWALNVQKAVMIQSGDIAGINTDAVWEAYKYLGFTKFGSVYKYSRGLV